ncbi:hypothetical protein HGRIS_014773 [Hohenbuehelia grisea]|uniref:Uncharacterized protein n=1 Tax=Hohenbuehelia grisea TaxID=104357 RepID=A0ABR3IQQ7_9AGAR
MMWNILASGVNQFLSFHNPPAGLSGILICLVSYPMGRAWAKWMPRWSIMGLPLNPGPFNIKEHVLILIISSVNSDAAYANDIFAVQRLVYGQNFNFIYQWLVVMSTQLIGFSFGGIARRILVDSPSMIWPTLLPISTFFHTLHSTDYSAAGGSGISRQRFFVYTCSGMFLYHFIPGYLFQALSYFSWVTWIRPEDPVVAQLFGYFSGLGMSTITFDWVQIVGFAGDPLIAPWWTSANITAGFLFFIWFISPILYFTNTWYAKYMPMSSTLSFDNTGAPYQVAQILNPDATVNFDAYHSYSPMFLSITFALSYGLAFASLSATLVHAILYYRQHVWTQIRHSLSEQKDIHARLMSAYHPVPPWWYSVLFLSTFVFGVIGIRVFPTELPVWAFIVALLISATFVIPTGIMAAITGTGVSLNVITEVIIGYALPGRPVAMMLFKSWGFNTMDQALNFISDMKIGFYMKIPPRTMFWSQVIATIVSGTVQLGVQAWSFTNIPDLCTPHQRTHFTCIGVQIFSTSSVMWGAIGPALQFQIYKSVLLRNLSRRNPNQFGQAYEAAPQAPLLYFFVIGAVAPVIPWLLARKYPGSFWKYVNMPVFFQGPAGVPPGTGMNYIPFGIIAYISQYLIKRRYPQWWRKYNYILSMALSTGVSIAILFIFFVLQFPENGEIGFNTIQSWIGNTIFMNGADFRGDPLIKLKPGETFGPSTW